MDAHTEFLGGVVLPSGQWLPRGTQSPWSRLPMRARAAKRQSRSPQRSRSPLTEAAAPAAPSAAADAAPSPSPAEPEPSIAARTGRAGVERRGGTAAQAAAEEAARDEDDEEQRDGETAAAELAPAQDGPPGVADDTEVDVAADKHGSGPVEVASRWWLPRGIRPGWEAHQQEEGEGVIGLHSRHEVVSHELGHPVPSPFVLRVPQTPKTLDLYGISYTPSICKYLHAPSRLRARARSRRRAHPASTNDRRSHAPAAYARLHTPPLPTSRRTSPPTSPPTARTSSASRTPPEVNLLPP